MLIMDNKMIKTILLDIDDTLYSYDKANKEALKQLYQYCQKQFGWDKEKINFLIQEAQREQKQVLNRDCSSIHNRLIRFQLMLEKEKKPFMPYALEMYHCYWDTLLKHIEVEPGVALFFRWAKQKNIRIGIATDMTAYIQYKKLERLDVLSQIDFIVTSEEVGVEKPHPKFFERCMEKAECGLDEVVMIGDNWNKDIIGARSIGMKALWYHPNQAVEENSLYTLKSFSELEKIERI